MAAERERRILGGRTPIECTLRRAVDQFRITRYDTRPSLIAGYPWFTDWSRDTLIALPALLATGFTPEETRNILEMLISERSEGLLPNRFGDKNSEPEYNTADATLWFFIAAKHYLDQTRDSLFLRESLYPAARDIIAWHQRGTKYGIRVDPEDHLLCAGTPETQLTWMDARVRARAITPRNGKPVEINALWYNALRVAVEWSTALGLTHEAEDLRVEAETMLASFNASFWNSERNCLFDVVTNSSRDAQIRPNQLFALSLPYPLCSPERGRLIVDLIKGRLLTPVGLRTLDPNDPDFRSRFEGSMAERDAAYHQGTVWPWLMGPFVEAYLYAYGETTDAVNFCRDVLNRLQQETVACCLGSIAEVYDAQAPHLPGGCPAQLWSVAQALTSMRRVNGLKTY